jgi:hypothetical protein
MVRRYHKNDVQIATKTVEIFECPECGFEFNAMHEVDNLTGGWECPLCEIDELQQKVKELQEVIDINVHIEEEW